MKSSLRKVLAESYVAPIAIAILMARAIVGAVEGLALPAAYGILSAVKFVMNAVTEREMPYIHGLDIAGLVIVTKNIDSLEAAVACAIAAWLVARLVYGTGPIRCLRRMVGDTRGMNAASLEKSAS